ncbi:hypothetical protein CMV_009882 [Castanea mollissima]|uniref:Uncharacterized protein n=1 Tax=Castanea mollissima TaxID=60419 RepID=A0A8J4RGJ3_9ROSI|nr:hypothetical protein CMV_009882 [Castanea mollissima]
MLEPDNYAKSGIGQYKFVAQHLKNNSGIKSSTSFAEVVRGHEVQVRRKIHFEKQNPVVKQNPVSLAGPMTLEGRVAGSRSNTEAFNVGNSLTIEVTAEGKRRVTWCKAGLRSSLSVSRDQREPCGSRANICSEVDLDKDGFHVGLRSEPNGPSRLEVSFSPPRRNLCLLSLKDQVLAKSKATYEASEAQDAIGVDFAPAEESPELSEKVASERQPAPTTATSSATQTETSCGPATVSVVDGGSFSDGSLAGASPAELDRADIGLLHTMRPDLVPVSSLEHLGCPAETLAVVISGGPSAVESLLTLGNAETEGERPFKGLELSTSVLSPPRVGIEANQSVLALSEVETAYAVEALGEAESSSPLMSINPLGVVVAAELNNNTEFMNNMRAILNPPLPREYYGNAYAISLAITTARELCENPLEYALELVRQKAKANIIDEYIRSL